MMNRHPLLPSQINHDAQAHLVCLPYAGGGAAAFHRWQPFIPPDIGLVPLRLPGREDRVADQAYADLLLLACDGADAISEIGQRPIALLGHSLGAYMALEVACELRRRKQPTPILLALSASPAPRLAKRAPSIGHLSDREFVDEIAQRYNGIPPAFRNDSRLLELLLPPLRADVRMWENYHPAGNAPLEVEILALGGAQDQRVPLSDLQAWRDYTTGRFSTRLFPGGHFFLFRNQEEGSDAAVPNSNGLQTIIDRLKRLLETR